MYLMTKATRDGFAYFYKVCAKICLDDRDFSENFFAFIFPFASTNDERLQSYSIPDLPTAYTASMLIGMPRLRQLRINEGICRFHPFYHVRNERNGMIFDRELK